MRRRAGGVLPSHLLPLALAAALALDGAGASTLGADDRDPDPTLSLDDACAAGDEACSVSLRQLRGRKVGALSRDPGEDGDGDDADGEEEEDPEVAPPIATGNASLDNGTTEVQEDVEYKPFNATLRSGSGAPVHTFYMYRAVSDEVYLPLNVNAANIAGVLWYLHHEVVIQYPRKFAITKIVRFKVQTKATQPIWDLGMNFGPRAAFDRGQCTGPFVCGRESTGSTDNPKFCNGAFDEAYEVNMTSIDGRSYGGPFEWGKYGFFVGCNLLGEYPFPMFPVYYPEATWYSLPGPCPSMTFDAQTKACRKKEPGGLCKEGPPTGEGDCTWTYELMGEVTLDELVGKPVAQLDNEGGREYDPDLDKGTRFSWWDGINDTKANLRRINETRTLFARKFPNQTLDEDMHAPPCDFNFGKFYREFYWRDPNKGKCRDEPPGSACFEIVTWGMKEGIFAHPEWYPGLTPQSSYKDFQRLLYMQHKGECPRRPCDKGEKEGPPDEEPVPAVASTAAAGDSGSSSAGPATPGPAAEKS